MKRFLIPTLLVVFAVTLLFASGCDCDSFRTGKCETVVYTPPPPTPPPPPPRPQPTTGYCPAPSDPYTLGPDGRPMYVSTGAVAPATVYQPPQQAYVPPPQPVYPAQPAPAMRNYAPQPTNVSMYPLSNQPPRSAPPVRDYTVAASTAYEAPVYAPPTTGVCWVVPPGGQTQLPDPPSVTYQGNTVVSSTPTGRLRPPPPAYSPQQQPLTYAPPVSPNYNPEVYRTVSSPEYQPVAYAPRTAPYSEVRPASFERPAATPLSSATTVQPMAPMVGGLQLVRAYDVPGTKRPSDFAVSQWFEIVRPNNAPMQIGRISSSCVCVGVRVPNRYIGQGERALVEARILQKPPANNLTYVIYVNTVEPTKQMLTGDVTIKF